MASNVVLSTQEYDVIGTRPVRHDGADKVTGRAQYGADIILPDMLYAKILRSPHAHARIKGIDTSKAEALPGVRAVVTGADFPKLSGKGSDQVRGNLENFKFLSNNCIADAKALYKGHAVAAVAATSAHIAEEALSLIEVDYEVLEPVFDVLEAMKEDAPILHEGLENVGNPPMRGGSLRPEGEPGQDTNVAGTHIFQNGDLEKGFKEADVVVEREFRTRPVHQGYIEPHTATAHWGADGKITVWCSSQGQFNVRDQTSQVLGLPVSKIKVIPMEIGGGFGGKVTVYLEPVAAMLSKKSGHPVKLTMSRIEEFEATGPTSGGYLKAKIGARKDGTITAADAFLALEAGAFPGSPVAPGCLCMFAPYNLENVRIEGHDVVLNQPKTAAYRAPGAPNSAFAAETLIDELAEKLGIDPLEMRIKNGSKEGTRLVTGLPFGKIGFIETAEAAKAHEHYNAPLEGPNRGRGVAAGFWTNSSGASSSVVNVNADGTVSLVEGSPDIGGSRAAIAMHVAEVLGIPVEDVNPSVADTDSIGYTWVTGGSSTLFKTGWTAYEAAQDVKRQLVERAATIWDVSPDDVDYSRGVLSHKSDPELKLTFGQIASKLNGTGGPVVGRSNFTPSGSGASFAIHIADVEVDPETGKVEILRYTALQDAGKAIHPSYVEGQMQGGAVQGIGWALNEEYFFSDDGKLMNSSFLDYRMPISLDLPMIDTVIVEVANPGHPFGARGVGEVPLVPPMAALANAIYRAVGVRMERLPMSPGAILNTLWNGEQ